MKFPSRIILAVFSLLPVTSFAQQAETYDYWAPQRELVQRGMQAVFMCNGIFTGKRTLEQVFAQELAYLNDPIGTPAGGDYTVDRELRMAEVGTAGAVPVMRAVFREGIGCVIMAPDQTIADING